MSNLCLARSLLATICLLVSTASQAQVAAPDYSRSWFVPALTENHDPICPAILAAAREAFVVDHSFAIDYGNKQGDLGPLEFVPLESLPTQVVPGDSSRNASLYPNSYIETGGQRLYLQTRTFPGCGGGCVTSSLNVAAQPLPWDFDMDRQGADQVAVATPWAMSWPLYRNTAGNWYTMTEVQSALQVFHIAAPARLKLACSVTLAPKLLESSDAAVRRAFASIQALEQAAGGIARGAGDCGSLRTAGRVSGYMHDALEQTLYRPWAIRNTGGSLPGFDLWALQGLSESRSVAQLESQFARSTQDLADFYVRKNGWTQEASLATARRALGDAVSAGFWFGTTEEEMSDVERHTRTALFNRRPVAELRTLAADAHMFDTPDNDSILNVAIEYPEALRDLLDRGADPDQANAFGKTPLMYAAQYNQLEAARILLEHGADPNAATVQPPDTCYYTLRQSRVTPLHYAARYASAAMIRLLVEHGSVTFGEATGSDAGTYAVDWLRYYTSMDGEDRNTNTAREEVEALSAVLRVPDATSRVALSRQLTRQAESEYAQSHQPPAYRLLKSALRADAANLRAQRNLALVALRTGRLGEAAEAAQVTVRQDPSIAAKADGWFNMGLVCEQYGQGYLKYNGHYYCRSNPLHFFLQAVRFDPTPARRNKIAELFASGNLGTPPNGSLCDVPVGATMQRYRLAIAAYSGDTESNPRQRIYVYHPSTQTIDPNSIRWEVNLEVNGLSTPSLISPRVTARYELGAFAVTELEGEHYIQSPVTIGSHTCPVPRGH